MIETDRVYIISLNNLNSVKAFSVDETTPEKVATYMLGRRIELFLLCRPNYTSIILKEHLHGKMMGEVVEWLMSKLGEKSNNF